MGRWQSTKPKKLLKKVDAEGGKMSKQKIKLEVEGLKVEPLKFFMEKQDKNLEDEIIKAIDGMYEKYVPAQTREYIDFQLKDEVQESVQEVEVTGLHQGKGNENPRSKRKNLGQKATKSKETVQIETNDQGAAQETGVQEDGIVQRM